jgi:hypothetical protein
MFYLQRSNSREDEVVFCVTLWLHSHLEHRTRCDAASEPMAPLAPGNHWDAAPPPLMLHAVLH